MTTPNKGFAHYLNLAQYLKKYGHNEESIRSKLIEQGADDQTIEVLFSQLEKQRHGHRRVKGVNLVFLGGAVLVIGFLLTYLFYDSGETMHYIMYSFTTLGILILGWGIVLIFH
jgi:hypothetical protein